VSEIAGRAPTDGDHNPTTFVVENNNFQMTLSAHPRDHQWARRSSKVTQTATKQQTNKQNMVQARSK
jgi:hypothetical protein